ncbi:uncharacterized protein BKCO1_9000136 [Diplodia corticola]|uniref:Uncharacterized protein n=1 Tax=Diplodia corticola TaxID=236234 RepID=A0A1J9SAH6_9PEZI|nr:uncharacterized protein BKCO1_9000136 [Diplodia corticola]OJD36876.1 hypothetical protein BKCO1_9000136 [Diplodia corticola]
MPASDRTSSASNNGKSLRPTLASSRTNKAPLTPKLASTQPAPSARAALGVSSTASRASTRDDPPSPHLSNVTPRSSSRKSRASSTQSTPTGTPDTPTAPRLTLADTIPRSAPGGSGPSRPRSIVGGNDGPRVGPVLAAPGGRNSRPSSEVGFGSKDSSAMFFHASEARRHEPTSNPVLKNPTNFFYASAPREGERSASAGVKSPPISASERSRPPNIESKFFHANTIHNDRGTNSPLHSPPILSATPDPHFHPHTSGKEGPRPVSPNKDALHLSYRKGASQIIRPNGHSRPASAVSVFSNTDAKDATPGHRRRSSTEVSGVQIGHHKSSSMSSIDSVCSNRRISGVDHSPSPLQVDITSPSTVMSASTNLNNDGRNGKEPNGLQSPLSLPQSPARQSPDGSDDADQQPKSALQKMNELAANARRERKVMDLEISNSSLLAINRQLEREVRKQKAELKRFRRMSRTGQMAPGGNNASSNLGSLTEGETAEFADEEVLGLGENEDDEDDDDQGELSSSESSLSESNMSASALAEKDAKYRFQDQKRLQLDLAKHKDILIDSQKMNQSLKRCLTVTEDLIKQGKKALEYKIRVSDVKLGGRILSPEDQGQSDSEEDEAPHGGSLLSPWTRPDASAAVRASLDIPRTDRDSGIDMRAPKAPADYFNGVGDSD